MGTGSHSGCCQWNIEWQNNNLKGLICKTKKTYQRLQEGSYYRALWRSTNNNSTAVSIEREIEKGTFCFTVKCNLRGFKLSLTVIHGEGNCLNDGSLILMTLIMARPSARCLDQLTPGFIKYQLKEDQAQIPVSATFLHRH